MLKGRFTGTTWWTCRSANCPSEPHTCCRCVFCRNGAAVLKNQTVEISEGGLEVIFLIRMRPTETLSTPRSVLMMLSSLKCPAFSLVEGQIHTSEAHTHLRRHYTLQRIYLLSIHHSISVNSGVQWETCLKCPKSGSRDAIISLISVVLAADSRVTVC